MEEDTPDWIEEEIYYNRPYFAYKQKAPTKKPIKQRHEAFEFLNRNFYGRPVHVVWAAPNSVHFSLILNDFPRLFSDDGLVVSSVNASWNYAPWVGETNDDMTLPRTLPMCFISQDNIVRWADPVYPFNAKQLHGIVGNEIEPTHFFHFQCVVFDQNGQSFRLKTKLLDEIDLNSIELNTNITDYIDVKKCQISLALGAPDLRQLLDWSDLQFQKEVWSDDFDQHTARHRDGHEITINVFKNEKPKPRMDFRIRLIITESIYDVLLEQFKVFYSRTTKLVTSPTKKGIIPLEILEDYAEFANAVMHVISEQREHDYFRVEQTSDRVAELLVSRVPGVAWQPIPLGGIMEIPFPIRPLQRQVLERMANRVHAIMEEQSLLFMTNERLQELESLIHTIASFKERSYVQCHLCNGIDQVHNLAANHMICDKCIAMHYPK